MTFKPKCNQWLKRWGAGLLMATTHLLVQADGITALAQFLKTTRSAQAQFTQTVTSPPRQGEAVGRSRASSGVFEFQRPNQFRFVYSKPFVQHIVSDGTSVWIHDADLDQTTQRPLKDVLQGTPAVLIAGGHMQALEKDFELRSVPNRAGLQWVQATPRRKDGPLHSIRLGFTPGSQGAQLAALEISDSLGQLNQMRFSGFQANISWPPGHFQFKRHDK